MQLVELKVVLASLSNFDQSFPSRCRIRQRKDFERALRNNCLINKWFAVHLFKNDNNVARLGLVVSKRTISKAVARNFAKRLIRECFRQNLTVLPSNDFVVKVRQKLTKSSASEARTALIALLLTAK